MIETRLTGEEVFSGKLLKVYCDQVLLPDGNTAMREYVKHPGACVVIAELRPGVLIFVRQFRYPLGKVFIEFPAGKIDLKEKSLGCAQRELLEETGYTAEIWQYVGAMHNCIGYSDEQIDIFLARQLSPGNQNLDEGEFVEVFELDIDAAESAVLDGRITDAKTITCLFWARRLIGDIAPR